MCMLLVFGGIQQGNDGVFFPFIQIMRDIFIFFELSQVLSLEFPPSFGDMSVRHADLRGRCNIFGPFIYMGLFFFYPSRPKPVDQYTKAICRFRWFIYALDMYLGYFHGNG